MDSPSIKEFRPGNLVQSGKVEYRIYAISEPQILAIQRADEPIGSQKGIFNCENATIDAIPLTEDWLVRFGFTFKNHWWKIEGFAIGCITRDDVYQFEVNAQMRIIDLWFVHQLQNLYHSLTGKSLESVAQHSIRINGVSL